MEFTEAEYRAAKRNANSVARLNSGYIEVGDALGAIYEWMLRNEEKVAEWREEGSKGYLNTALYRAGIRYALDERKRITGAQDRDFSFYSAGQLEEILPLVWDYDDWFLSNDGPNYIRSAASNPAENNTRLAMLVDVSTAVNTLPHDDIDFLRLRFEKHFDLERVGEFYELTEDGARKRLRRILKRLVRALGGEPPWADGPGTRKVVSNAGAQQQVRT